MAGRPIEIEVLGTNRRDEIKREAAARRWLPIDESYPIERGLHYYYRLTIWIPLKLYRATNFMLPEDPDRWDVLIATADELQRTLDQRDAKQKRADRNRTF